MNPKKALSVFSTIAAVLLFVALGMGLYAVISGTTAFGQLIYAMLLLTTLFGLYYVLAGCKKAAGIRYFGAYLNLFALCQLVILLGRAKESNLSVLLLTVTFGLIVLLAGAKDLGKVKSITLSALIVLLSAARLGAACANGHFAQDGFTILTCIVIAISTLVLIFAKYADKAARGK